MKPIPVTILTGFLGSGKTTLLKGILEENHRLKIAVIENEFGEESIDNEILTIATEEEILQMNNGCVCCTIRDDLRGALRMLAARRSSGSVDFDRVVIETTGLADPGPVAQTFFMDDGVASRYVLDSIVTLVDAKHAQKQLDDRQEARRQVGFADRILLSKTDLVSTGELDAVMSRLRRMNPRAPQKAVQFGNLPINEVLDVQGFNLDAKLELDPKFLKDEEQGACDGHHDDHEHGVACKHSHHHHHDDDVKSFSFRTERALDARRLEAFFTQVIKSYGPQMLRYKGVLQLEDTDRKVIFQGVHQLLGSDFGPGWAEGERRTSKMVFIGIDLPREIFLQGLEQCLV